MSTPLPARPRPVVLAILDGFGERTGRDDNAVRLAATPHLDALTARYPRTLLGASGPDVGLPPGQMGNSEVGHLNFGAGRVAMMDISRINGAVADGSLGRNPVVAAAFAAAKSRGGRVHLLGLVSDGGVHSSLEHLLALVDAAAVAGVPVVVHAFLDGRDTAPRSAAKYLAPLAARLEGRGVLGTLSGRFFAMDRDQRWERVAQAYGTVVRAEGPRFATWQAGLEAAYAEEKGDEFVPPRVLGDYAGVEAGRDAGLMFNFRPDRAREIVKALTAADFAHFDRGGAGAPFAHFACMTQYDPQLGLPVAYPKELHPDIFPEVIARAGLTQFRCAETEKYAHVTYFFNGGVDTVYPGEDRKVVPSPRDVATYDLKPEMSAAEVTREVVAAIGSGRYDFVLVNFANPDMVGHTGVLSAAIRAVETVNAAVGAVAEAVLAAGGALFVTADHGNCETMVDPVTGGAHTAHTVNPVPLWYVRAGDEGRRLRQGGRISDVAPTMLALLGVAQPAAMTGRSLFAED